MGARSIAVDVTVKHTLAPSYVSNLAQTALGVAREGERVKIVKYEAESKAMGMELLPSLSKRLAAGALPLRDLSRNWLITQLDTQAIPRLRHYDTSSKVLRLQYNVATRFC